MFDFKTHAIQSIDLLISLIACPSFSRDEAAAGDILQKWFHKQGIKADRDLNNIYVSTPVLNPTLPLILLNSHLDTVKPNPNWTMDPFSPIQSANKLYGLGSNDAGASLVCLASVFSHYFHHPSPAFNLMFVASAEEEISGENGISRVLPLLSEVDFAIVGEPTEMKMAIAERGLMVVDFVARGEAGHAANGTGINAIYQAIEDIDVLKNLHWDKVSELLGKVSLQVTSIQTENVQHNVVPDICQFVADIRLNEYYTHDEVLQILNKHIKSAFKVRSKRLKSSIIPLDHPLVTAGLSLGMEYYGSPTISDKALMPFPALKLGPGASARSHTADEFIYLDEIEQGLRGYYSLLESLKL